MPPLDFNNESHTFRLCTTGYRSSHGTSLQTPHAKHACELLAWQPGCARGQKPAWAEECMSSRQIGRFWMVASRAKHQIVGKVHLMMADKEHKSPKRSVGNGGACLKRNVV